MSQENIELVRRAYERLGEGDALGDSSWFFEEFAHDELELRAAGTYLDAASSYQGRQGWARFWRDFSAVWAEWHFDPDTFEFFDAGEKVVVFARAVGRGKRAASRSRRTRPIYGRSATGRCCSASLIWTALRPSKPPGCRSSALDEKRRSCFAWEAAV